MPESAHKDLSGINLHEAFHYVQSSDPGAVGAGLYWLDTTSTPFQIKRRNAGNTGWNAVGSSITLATVAEAGTGTATDKAVTPAGLFPASADVASGATCNIGGAASLFVRITGTTTITAFDNVAAGIRRIGYFAGILTLTHNSTSLILPGAANIVTAAGDSFEAISLGSGNWKVVFYQKADGTAIVGGSASAAWPPLDQYTIDGTYGDHFTGASLSGSWTRRNFTSGAEGYQKGYNQTYLRIATAGRAAGDGYFRPAPAGDWTFAMKFIPRLIQNPGWGLAVIDTSGNGISICGEYSAPIAMLITNVTTYSTYGGTYSEVGYGISPNVSTWNNGAFPLDRPYWQYLRKSGTNYYAAYSMDGEIWSPETAALSWAGTVDRVGMLQSQLGNVVNTSVGYLDIDWFNKIA